MKKLKVNSATNDDFIFELLQDQNYKVTEHGQLLTRYTNHKKVSGVWRKVGTKDRYGYLIFKPRMGGKKRYLRVHRIIYAFYYKTLEKDKVINHRDGDRTNNQITNLELVDWEFNNKYRV